MSDLKNLVHKEFVESWYGGAEHTGSELITKICEATVVVDGEVGEQASATINREAVLYYVEWVLDRAQADMDVALQVAKEERRHMAVMRELRFPSHRS